MCWLFPSTKALITFPSADSERLIFVASFNRSPVAPVLLCLSEPARSTKFNFPTQMWSSPSKPLVWHSTTMVKMECERDDSWFIIVEPTDLFFFPACITWSISWELLTTNEVKSFTYTPESAFSCGTERGMGNRQRARKVEIGRGDMGFCTLRSNLFLGSFESRSRISSL